jgi:phage tail sheath protein FI
VNLPLPAFFLGATLDVTAVESAGTGSFSTAAAGSNYQAALAAANVAPLNSSGQQLVAQQQYLVGCYFDVQNAGFAPDGTTPVVNGDRVALVYNGTTYSWAVVAAAALGGDLSTVGQVCFGAQVELSFAPEQVVPSNLWRFDAVTSTELIDRALRGVGFNGVPQAVFIEAGVDNVNRLFDDSQRYFNPFGFIAFYGPWIENGAGQFIPPSPYVTGVAVRRYRSEGYQFPPAGVKYQLADAVSAQIPINSSQQNLLNPQGCNAIRTLPGYPQSAVFIWGGRTRVNPDDAQQRLYQFVNTRVILNVVYGSLRNAFDSQIFNVIDGFGIVYNQIISIGNSILNQLYVRGALFGATPSDAFQVICDSRINLPENLENGIVSAKVFVTPVPTLERIQIDLIRVAIGKMQDELDIQGLGNGSV